MVAQTLTFLSWSRPSSTALASVVEQARLVAAAPVTLTTADGRSNTTAIPFAFTGHADVVGLAPGAIVRRYPAPGTTDHESDRCPYIELADPTLPWRYTPAVNPAGSSAALHPWFVLLVGEPSELATDGTTVTIEPSAQLDASAVGAPNGPYRFAHVQVDANGHRVARVLCSRPLQPGTVYRAVVVPAFDATGAPTFDGRAPVSLEAFDAWEFTTATPAGSFEELAARLHPGTARATLGSTDASYPRLTGAMFTVRGALVGTAEPAAIDADITADVANLTLPERDPAGRPIVRLPRYGDSWISAGATWAETINTDPAHRSIAGLGLEVGIQAQESLVDDVLTHLGDLRAARERVRHLAFGVALTRGLWQRRIPADAIERLWVLGPATGAVATEHGSVRALATADDRALPAGSFSAAARRVLRRGTARNRASTAGAIGGQAFATLNAVLAPAPAVAETGFDDATAGVLRSGALVAVQARAPSTTALQALLESQTAAVATPARAAATAARAWAEGGAGSPGGPAVGAMAAVLVTMAEADTSVLARRRQAGSVLADAIATFTDLSSTGSSTAGDPPSDATDAADLAELSATLYAPQAQPDPALRPVAIDALAGAVDRAFDPLVDLPPAARRVLPFIDGAIDPARPLAPPEICVGLRRAAWLDARDAVSDFLLPGVGELDENAVIAVATNPTFVDAFLVGLNTQLLAELRWRNIPVATGCTPIRRFWERVDVAGARVDDIAGVANWPMASDLGDPSHGAASADLVLVIRGELFHRYPATVVSLLRAALTGASANFDADPDPAAVPLHPSFHGRLSRDTVFFGFAGVRRGDLASRWVVLEEPPAGYRFANDNPAAAAATSGHDWAAAALAKPVRVLIRGDVLVDGG